MPVRIEDASPATVSGSSGVVYMAINVANFDRPSDMFAALYMGDWRIATSKKVTLTEDGMLLLVQVPSGDGPFAHRQFL